MRAAWCMCCRPRLAAPASSAASEGASRSFDEEDTRTRLEFDGVVGSVRGMHKAAAHLDLMWRLQARKVRRFNWAKQLETLLTRVWRVADLPH